MSSSSKTSTSSGPKRGRRTVATIEKALRETYGLVSVAANRLGMSRRNLYRRIEKSERLQAVLVDSRELIIDTGELKLITAVQNGEPWAISLVLKTIGKNRGYVERSEVDNLRDADLSRVPTEELREWLSQKR